MLKVYLFIGKLYDLSFIKKVVKIMYFKKTTEKIHLLQTNYIINFWFLKKYQLKSIQLYLIYRYNDQMSIL